MADLTIADIRRAIKNLKRCGASPANFYCSQNTADAIIRKAEELAPEILGHVNGATYILGLRIITRLDVDDRTCYIGSLHDPV